jgi:hypothetical protein
MIKAITRWLHRIRINRQLVHYRRGYRWAMSACHELHLTPDEIVDELTHGYVPSATPFTRGALAAVAQLRKDLRS